VIDKSNPSQVLSLFYDIIEASYDSIYYIQPHLLGSPKEFQIQSLAKSSLTGVENIVSKYSQLISLLSNGIMLEIWNDTLASYSERLSAHFHDVKRCLVEGQTVIANVQFLIMDLQLSGSAIELKLKSLWELTIAHLLTHQGDILGLDIVKKFYPMLKSYAYLKCGMIQSHEARENKDDLLAISSVYLQVSKDLGSDIDQLKSFIKSAGYEESLKDPRIYQEVYAKLEKVTESMKDKILIEIKFIDEIGVLLKTIWMQIFTNIFSKGKVSSKATHSKLKELFEMTPGEVESGNIAKLLNSLATSGSENGHVYLSFRRYKEAVDEYEIVRSAYSEGLDFFQGTDSSDLNSALTVALEYWQRQKEQCLDEGRLFELKELGDAFAEGQNQFEQGLYLEAIKNYDVAIEAKELVDEEVASVLVKKGNVFADIGRHDKALSCYFEATQLKPGYTEAVYNIGNTLLELGRYEEAESSFDKALNLNRKDYDALWGKALAVFYLKRFKEAVRFFDAALELNQNSEGLWFNRGLALYKNEDYDDARKSFEKVKELNPDSIENFANLAEIMLIQKKYPECEELLHKVNNMPGIERYQFAISLMNVCCLYLSEKKDQAIERTVGLLGYYESNYNESISTESNTDVTMTETWTYEGLKKSIEENDYPPAAKDFIISLISLTTAKTSSDMIEAIRKVKNYIPRTEQKQSLRDKFFAPFKEHEISESEIKVVNTSSHIKGRDGWYHWEIHLQASKEVLSEIKNVSYALHPTFNPPTKIVSDSKNGFQLEQNGWGEFKIKVRINLKDGRVITKFHWLNLRETKNSIQEINEK
jgi:tetratricopeptide (TPR) repeat protein